MKLIIDIDEDVRVAITRVGLLRIPDEMQKKVDRAIQNGTPLPKGHGRLKDADAICKDILSALGIRNEYCLLEAEKDVYKRIKNASTIIEADKGE